VIRELLSAHIRPENLPTGNTVSTPAPIPGRRTSAPIVKGSSGSAMSDPSRKPSRVRAAEAAAEEGADTGRRAPKKEGWAKAKPKFEHTKTFKPRERTAPRPKTEGEGSERPKRAFKPREDQFIDKPRGERSPPRGGGSRGPGKPAFGDKPRSGGAGRPSGGFGGKPGGSRPSGGGFGGKPGGSRPSGGGRGGPRGPRRDD
jgi:23S rRNA pseudouridine2605 synthase